MRIIFALIVLVGLGAILFATIPENRAFDLEFVVPFIDTTLTGSRLWTVLGAWLLGLVMGYLAAFPGTFSAKRRAKKLEKQVAAVGEKAGQTAADAQATVAAASPAAPTKGAASAEDAAETQRLADEVARRTATIKRDA
ncbi:MAG: hypothetical protein AAFQ43_05630 [Bacteroidota bacterium]